MPVVKIIIPDSSQSYFLVKLMNIFWKMAMKNANWLRFVLLFLIISGCAHQVYRATPLPFETAVRIMTEHLFDQVVEQRSFLDSMQDSSFVVDPVIDADTGEVTSTSQKIADLMKEEVQQKRPQFTLHEMNQEHLSSASYVISGIMKLEQYEGTAKFPHLTLSIVNTKSGQIVAHSDAWISNAKLEFKPMPMYQDSPMYIKDRRVDALIATAHAAAGSMVQKEYFNTLTASALLNEASAAYDKNDYKLALGLFAKTAARDDGQVMKTYAGLYQSFFRLGDMKSAEDAFATLTKFGLKVGNISVKFLFDVDNVEFFKNEKLQEYPIWLRQIAKTINESDACIKIVGHASHSGTEDYNKLLSRRRAEYIQQLLGNEVKEVLNKTKTEGVGFAENIIGTGTDDARDAIDRRVEFKVVKCGD